MASKIKNAGAIAGICLVTMVLMDNLFMMAMQRVSSIKLKGCCVGIFYSWRPKWPRSARLRGGTHMNSDDPIAPMLNQLCGKGAPRRSTFCAKGALAWWIYRGGGIDLGLYFTAKASPRCTLKRALTNWDVGWRGDWPRPLFRAVDCVGQMQMSHALRLSSCQFGRVFLGGHEPNFMRVVFQIYILLTTPNNFHASLFLHLLLSPPKRMNKHYEATILVIMMMTRQYQTRILPKKKKKKTMGAYDD